MNIKIKQLDEKAQIPRYAKEGDAGLDLVATSKRYGAGYVAYGTGLAVEIPEGYVGLLFPRSSASKTDLMLANSVGVIDSGYRGEIECRFKRVDRFPRQSLKIYEIGDRIAQLVIIPHPKIEFDVVQELTPTNRGDGGFGSSGV